MSNAQSTQSDGEKKLQIGIDLVQALGHMNSLTLNAVNFFTDGSLGTTACWFFIGTVAAALLVWYVVERTSGNGRTEALVYGLSLAVLAALLVLSGPTSLLVAGFCALASVVFVVINSTQIIITA